MTCSKGPGSDSSCLRMHVAIKSPEKETVEPTLKKRV